MKEQKKSEPDANLTAAQETLQQLWEEHVRHEFATHNTEDTLATMVDDAYVNHIPVLTGGVGKDELREFYSERFIPQMPPDTEMTSISRTIGNDQLVDEMVFKFTHTIRMDWMLPGIAPTGKRVEVPLVAIVRFKEGKLAHEHIYWDQASALVQVGLLDAATLPVVGSAKFGNFTGAGLSKFSGPSVCTVMTSGGVAPSGKGPGKRSGGTGAMPTFPPRRMRSAPIHAAP